MSDIAVTWAKAQDVRDADGEKDRNAKDVLVYLASYSDAHGEAWAAIDILSYEMAIAARMVQRGLAAIRCKPGDDRGFIEETGRKKLYCGKLYPLYRLRLERGPSNTREALKALREQAVAEPSTGDAGDTPSADLGVTPVTPQDATHDATGDTGDTPRGDAGDTQIGKLKGKSLVTSSPKSARARGGGKGDSSVEFWKIFDAIGFAVPAPMRKITQWTKAKSAYSRLSRKVTPEAMLAAAKRFAADPDVMKREVLPGLEVWLVEMLPAWLDDASAVAALPAAPIRPAILADAPDTVREIALSRGDAWARSWLTGAVWDGERQAIICRLQLSADRVTSEIGRELKALGVGVLGPVMAASEQTGAR